CTRTRVDFW
nr:immunoglobulin heavy chain junction region [Macaca mulatta]